MRRAAVLFEHIVLAASSKSGAGNKGSHEGDDSRARSEVRLRGKQGRGESRYKDVLLRQLSPGRGVVPSLGISKEGDAFVHKFMSSIGQGWSQAAPQCI